MLCLALPACRKVQKLDFQSEFSMSKIIRISLIFFSLKNNMLGAHFLLRWFFDNIKFKRTLLLKLGQIFDKVAKLSKSTQDTYNQGGWLILSALLKNGVAKCVAFKVNDFVESTCPLTSFFCLLSPMIYLKLAKVLKECLFSQSLVISSRTSFSVCQQLRPELSAKWMLSILSDLPLTRKTKKNAYFSIFQIFEW